MSETDPGAVLNGALLGESADTGQVRALQELAYTASERGILPFGLDTESAETLIKLVGLAAKFSDGVPVDFRM